MLLKSKFGTVLDKGQPVCFRKAPSFMCWGSQHAVGLCRHIQLW